MTPEINLLYALLANHPRDGRELANIGKRSRATDATIRHGRRLPRLPLRRMRPAGSASRA